MEKYKVTVYSGSTSTVFEDVVDMSSVGCCFWIQFENGTNYYLSPKVFSEIIAEVQENE